MELPCTSDPACPLALPWARPGSLPSRSWYRAQALTEPLTVPNLVIAKGGTRAQVAYYNNSPGNIELIVDEYGYFMNPG